MTTGIFTVRQLQTQLFPALRFLQKESPAINKIELHHITHHAVARVPILIGEMPATCIEMTIQFCYL